ncbi:MAG TPA: NRDE family protein [Flavobacteriaceae bacterium]|nr:NRDE family protein [Flavobacteriaceae bacterium]
MCTLTFIPHLKSTTDFILTSNRDESPNRKTIFPKLYFEEGMEMCYPKDELAGGTWIGASSRKRLVCLLNGGFEAHNRLKHYRKSRGLVVKELLAATDTFSFLEKTELNKIEPFTIVSVDWNKKLELHQLVWDGNEKQIKQISVSPQIWSASMLYSSETKKEREQLFLKFINEEREFDREDIMGFQKKFVIDRELVKTTSITQFVHSQKTSEMRYLDLQTGKTISTRMKF